MKTISVSEFKNILAQEQDSLDSIFIDVRSPIEYKAERIAGVKNIPMTDIEDHIDMLKGYKHIYIHCRSGKRGMQAQCDLEKLGLTNTFNVEGGIDEWKALSGSTIEGKVILPLQQQVHLTLGVLLLTFSALSWFVSPWFIIGSAFLGAGLSFAGATGTCGMAMLIARMPWNK